VAGSGRCSAAFMVEARPPSPASRIGRATRVGDGARGEGAGDLLGDRPPGLVAVLLVAGADLLGAAPGDLEVVLPCRERGLEPGALTVGEVRLAGAQDIPDPVRSAGALPPRCNEAGQPETLAGGPPYLASRSFSRVSGDTCGQPPIGVGGVIYPVDKRPWGLRLCRSEAFSKYAQEVWGETASGRPTKERPGFVVEDEERVGGHRGRTLHR